MAAAKSKQASKKSTIAFERLPGNRLRVSARFFYQSARYEVQGVVDADKKRVEPFHHEFTVDGARVFDSVMGIGGQSIRTDFKFGPATTGVRQLHLRTERLRQGSLVTGTADGDEMLPVVANGCSCDDTQESKRPILTWSGDGTTRRVTVALRSAKAGDEIGGLSGVVHDTISAARIGGFGGLGDLGDEIDDVFCILECIGSYLQCLLKSIFTPGGSILMEICSVIGGGPCIDLCGFGKL
jgi:hypothetical protein